jgi:hypothetical protein
VLQSVRRAAAALVEIVNGAELLVADASELVPQGVFQRREREGEARRA